MKSVAEQYYEKLPNKIYTMHPKEMQYTANKDLEVSLNIEYAIDFTFSKDSVSFISEELDVYSLNIIKTGTYSKDANYRKKLFNGYDRIVYKPAEELGRELDAFVSQRITLIRYSPFVIDSLDLFSALSQGITIKYPYNLDLNRGYCPSGKENLQSLLDELQLEYLAGQL